jgi:hypothetical protein
MPSVSSIAYNPSLAACWMRSSSFIFPSARVVADREGAAQVAPSAASIQPPCLILSASHSSASLRIASGSVRPLSSNSSRLMESGSFLR